MNTIFSSAETSIDKHGRLDHLEDYVFNPKTESLRNIATVTNNK